jgi:DNA-binding NtrC family response regulator
MPSVLIVDDLLSIHEMLQAVIEPTGFSTSFATDGEKALIRYHAQKFDLVLADIDMKPMDGITLLRQLKRRDPNVVVIIMTAYASTESAIQALKFGAFDFLQKPFRVDELISTLRRGIEFKRVQSERSAGGGRPTLLPSEIETRLVGRSAAIKRLTQQIRKLSALHTSVLLVGEPGSGKGTAARVLHAASFPADTPFVFVDCAIGTAAGLRVALLGEDGTGGAAVSEAHGGTLYLRSVQSLPLEMQPVLASVLRNHASHLRLVCSTTADLEALTAEGKFHEELFYRVAPQPVHLLPLRERTEDIPLLALQSAGWVTNPYFDPEIVAFSEDAFAALAAYSWPGNLAEFNQVIAALSSTAKTPLITAAQLPKRLRAIES